MSIRHVLLFAILTGCASPYATYTFTNTAGEDVGIFAKDYGTITDLDTEDGVYLWYQTYLSPGESMSVEPSTATASMNFEVYLWFASTPNPNEDFTGLYCNPEFEAPEPEATETWDPLNVDCSIVVLDNGNLFPQCADMGGQETCSAHGYGNPYFDEYNNIEPDPGL